MGGYVRDILLGGGRWLGKRAAVEGLWERLEYSCRKGFGREEASHYGSNRPGQRPGELSHRGPARHRRRAEVSRRQTQRRSELISRGNVRCEGCQNMPKYAQHMRSPENGVSYIPLLTYPRAPPGGGASDWFFESD